MWDWEVEKCGEGETVEGGDDGWTSSMMME